MTREEAEIRIRAVFNNYFYFAGDREADEVIKALRQEPKYCDRDICIRNEYNGIGCGECEVTKSQEPCEDCCNGNQEEKAKLCQKSYLAGMKHRQEPCEDAISKQAVLNILDDMVKDYIKENDFDKAQGIAWVKVQKLTSVQPKQKTGHWITKIKSDLWGDMWPTNPKCSECGGEPYFSNTIYNYKFCPYCGAKMAESEETE